MLVSLLVFALAAPAEPSRILVMDLEAVGVSATDAAAATRVVASAAADVAGVTVMSAADLRRIASLEAERAQAGCADDTACVADLADALGAQRVLYGSMSRLGSTTTVVLVLYTQGQEKAERRSVDVDDLAGLSKILRERTVELLSGVPAPSTEPVNGDDGASFPVMPTAVLVGGASVAVAGAVLIVVAESIIQSKDAAGSDKATWQTIGLGSVIGAGAGVVLAGVGGALFALGGE